MQSSILFRPVKFLFSSPAPWALTGRGKVDHDQERAFSVLESLDPPHWVLLRASFTDLHMPGQRFVEAYGMLVFFFDPTLILHFVVVAIKSQLTFGHLIKCISYILVAYKLYYLHIYKMQTQSFRSDPEQVYWNINLMYIGQGWFMPGKVPLGLDLKLSTSKTACISTTKVGERALNCCTYYFTSVTLEKNKSWK